MDFIRVYGTLERERIRAVVGELRLAGIGTVLFPAERSSGRWDVEVAGEDVERAREILAAASA